MAGRFDDAYPTGCDVLIVGAGSAGALAASVLSADTSREVVVVEAGREYRAAATPYPIRSANFGMALTGEFHWGSLMARPNRQQKPHLYLQGKGVGGSSAINAQAATWALPDDYDRWQRAGATGWTYLAVESAYRAIESDLDFGDDPRHGNSGPLPVSRTPRIEWGPVSAAFAAAAAAAGHVEHPDHNAPDAHGLSPTPFTRDHRGRVSTNDAYLDSALSRTNLRLFSEVFVDRLQLDGDRVVGAVIRADGAEHFLSTDEVVIAAGALHTPALLLRSGIGPPSVVQQAGRTPRIALPGVGARLQDHPMVWLDFALREGARLPHPDLLPGHCTLRYTAGHTAWAEDTEIVPLDRGPMDLGRGGMMVSLLTPTSTGAVTLAVDGSPVIELGLLDTEHDRAALAAGVAHALELLHGTYLAALRSGPVMTMDGQLVSGRSGAELRQLLTATVQEYYHACGTCAMGVRPDDGAVVDPSGLLHGVSGVRIVDSSAIPVIPRSATLLPTLTMAHRMLTGS